MVSKEWYMPLEEDAVVPVRFGQKPTFVVPTNGPPRLKRHAPKVRSGCITCKARRVKCDETKPACRRCTSTGRRCDGYNLPKPLLFEISEDKDERWSFHYFRDRTSSEIHSFADHGFWNRLVIQAGYSGDTVRHALAAIGSYHEGVDHLDEMRRADKQKFALQQYNKSINGVLKSSADSDIEEILLAIILFTFFENIRGEWASALAHLQAGLRILTNWRAAHPPHQGKSEVAQRVEERIVPVLEQLQIVATSLLQMIPAKKSRYSTYMPDRFHDLRTARFYFYELLHAVCAKMQSNHDEFPWPKSDTVTLGYAQRLLKRWYNVFQEYLVRAQRSCSCDSLHPTAHFDLGMYHLELQYWAAIIRLECKPFRMETSFDEHHDNFMKMIDIANSFCDIFVDPAIDPDTICIGFEVNYLATISVVALRCRDPQIRREAIKLMRRYDRMPGKTGALAIAEISENIMQLEESRSMVPVVQTAQDIPLTARLHLLGCSPFKWNAVSQKFELTYELLGADLIKFRVLPSGIDPAEVEIETHWIDRRTGRGVEPLHSDHLPEDVSGFFPQTLENLGPVSKLWSTIGGRKVAMFLERASTSHICQCQSCAVRNEPEIDVVAGARQKGGVFQATDDADGPFIITDENYIPFASPQVDMVTMV